MNDILFEPVTLGGIHLKNRIVMSPMTRNFSPGGTPGAGVEDYYRRRAENDVGLIVTEGVGIDHKAAIGIGSMGETDMPLLYGEAALARWRIVVEHVHRAGGVIFPQLWHQGVMRQHHTGPHPESESARPSGIWGPFDRLNSARPDYLERMRIPSRPMTDSEIADVIAGFARSAANAKSVGFDGIAIHGAHGYLIDTFFWRETNLRGDAWGGDIAGRARFGAELVRAIRAAIGPAMPIMFRYSQWKQQDYDARLADTPQELETLLRPLVEAGVTIFDASTRIYSRPAFAGSPLSLAGWTKKVTGIPTAAVGGIGFDKELRSSFTETVSVVNNLDDVARRIAEGEFDLACVGRSLLIDPAWVLKARAGLPFEPFSLAAFGKLY